MDVRNSKLGGNIWKFHLHEILSSMFFSVPIMVLFWQNNGLSLTEIMVLQSIFAISVVLLEIPTGYFADIYGRKKSLVIASIFGLIAMIAYSLGDNFFNFLIGEIFIAINISFVSGTSSAIVYDTLKDLKREKEYKKTWGSIVFYGMIALAISNILGGFIAKVDLRYTLYASIPFFLMVIPLTFSIKEPSRHKIIIKKGYLRELLKIIKLSLVESKKLRWIVIYSGVIYAFNQSALWLYQPYFRISGIDIVYFGVIFASFQIVAAFSSKYAYKLEKKLGQKYSLIMLIILIGVSYLLMSNFVFLFSFSFCFIQQFARGFKKVVITDYINKLTNSSIRATVLSVESFVGRLLYALIIPIFGLIADVYNVTQALTVIGVTTLIFGIIVLLILRKEKIF